MESHAPQSALADLVDLAEQFERDEQMTPAERRRRDRAIGRSLAPLEARPVRQVRAWLSEVRQQRQGGAKRGERRNDEQRAAGARVATAHRIVAFIMAALGLVLGVGAASVVLYYDGSRPVNVVNFLAVFVALQLLTVLLFVIAMLPPGVLRFVPGSRAVQDFLRAMSPARLEPLIAKLLPQSHREALQRTLGQQRAHQSLYGRTYKWLFGVWSQIFAVMFNVGALAGCLFLTVFSDLAFAWSTTLQVDAAEFHRLTRTLSAPWRSWWPDAAPSASLIESTRYFRFGEGVLANGGATPDAAQLGGWWPFLLACLLFYGLLPRIVTLTVARWRLAAATNEAIAHLPGVAALRDRLNNELVSTSAGIGEDAVGDTDGAKSSVLREQPISAAHSCIINWAAVPVDDDEIRGRIGEAFAIDPGDVFHAGGTRDVDEDERVIESLAALSQEIAVFVVVKAWEPPLLEIVDFLRDLRKRMGDHPPIVVVPAGHARGGRLTPPTDEQTRVWAHQMQTVGDPRLQLKPLSEQPEHA